MAKGFQSARLVNSTPQMTKSGQVLVYADIQRKKAHPIPVIYIRMSSICSKLLSYLDTDNRTIVIIKPDRIPGWTFVNI